jgi:DNA repair protein RecO (recombination protein O)
MPLVESEAIILRSTVFAEADKLVSFFSRTQGRVRGIAPAARKSRKRFGPALEPLTHVRIWFFDKENKDLARLEQCELLESFWDAAPDYERSVALSHIAELCELLLPEREPHERNFRLTLMTLRCLGAGQPLLPTLTYFQLWSTRLAGWLPEFDRCSRCHSSLPEGEPVYASPSDGRLYCRNCRQPGTRTLHPGSRAAALKILSGSLEHLGGEEWDKPRLTELQRFLLDLIEHHAERKLATRELLHATA